MPMFSTSSCHLRLKTTASPLSFMDTSKLNPSDLVLDDQMFISKEQGPNAFIPEI